jgi:cytochrome d ubiquinol oxidase subunit II
MFELWFGIVVLMFTAYAVLDGYDLGAGALHLLVARTDEERRTVLAAVGPFWDANEVWLLAGGGALFVAFPAALASGLSGFYLAIFLVLWCLILRGVAIEFRSHLGDPLWRGFWDGLFTLASALLPVLFGAALGNLVRGVPLTARGWFQLTLFTSFLPRDPVGILDWYTVLAGVLALVALAGQGATFLAWRTTGAVHERSRRLSLTLFSVLAVLWPLATIATHAVSPMLLSVLPSRPLAWLGLLLAVGGLVTALVASARRWSLAAFLGSSAFLTGMALATATCLFPVLLRATGGAGRDITAFNAGSSSNGLRTALGWWVIGFPLAVAYFVVQFRLHRGKVGVRRNTEGY